MKQSLFVILTGLFLMATSPAYSAVDIFMKIEDIKGESTDELHADWIELQSYDVGVSREISPDGSIVKYLSPGLLGTTKTVDKSTPDLNIYCASGKHIPKVQVVVRQEGRTGRDYFVTIELSDVVIKSINTESPVDKTEFRERIAFSFAKMEMIYIPQNPDGTTGAPIITRWAKTAR